MPDRIVQPYSASRRPGPDSDGAYLRVLVVQRHGRDVEALEHVFRLGGYVPSIKQVPDVHALGEALQQGSWHLVVAAADAGDPYRVLQIVQQTQPDLAVVLIAEQVGQEDIIQGLHAGAHDVVTCDRLASVLATVRRMRFLEQERRACDPIPNTWNGQGRAVEAAGIGRIVADVQQPDRSGVSENSAFYRAIVEDQAEYVCRFRPDGELTFVNQAYGRMFGKTPDELVGQNFLNWLPDEDRVYCRHHLASLSLEQPVCTIEHQVRMPDGEVRWQQWTDRALFDPAGTLVEFQSTGHDITERKLAEQEREKLIEELDAFAHTVAHDLKSPLMTLIGFAEILEEEHEALTPEQLREFAGFIGRYAHKMHNIIDELMLLANVRRAGVQVEPLDMETVVADALQRLGYLIEEYEPEITLPAAWPMALGHAPWVAEVWVNYISNAIKYGGRPPRVVLGAKAQGEGMIQFWIRDNGTGLSAEAQERLFKPFERLEQVRGGGQGLGLSIVRRIVERLGGAVSVASEGLDGRGSEFSFTLPAVASSGDTGLWCPAL